MESLRGRLLRPRPENVKLYFYLHSIVRNSAMWAKKATPNYKGSWETRSLRAQEGEVNSQCASASEGL